MAVKMLCAGQDLIARYVRLQAYADSFSTTSVNLFVELPFGKCVRYLSASWTVHGCVNSRLLEPSSEVHTVSELILQPYVGRAL
jgi:hypothetical protein